MTLRWNFVFTRRIGSGINFHYASDFAPSRLKQGDKFVCRRFNALLGGVDTGELSVLARSPNRSTVLGDAGEMHLAKCQDLVGAFFDPSALDHVG